jgi:hypothetical protein
VIDDQEAYIAFVKLCLPERFIGAPGIEHIIVLAP